MKSLEGGLQAAGKSFAIVASRFNDTIVDALIRGALGTLESLGAAIEGTLVVRVPGAFEIPPVAKRLAASGRFHAVLCLGAVIRGETPHFEHVAGEASSGISQVARESPVPVIFGVLTTDTVEQAMDRAGLKSGNKGSEAALAAVQMASLFEALDAELKKR